MNTMLKLTIGIVAYNEEKYLPGLLGNICQQKYPHSFIEIVFVDSMSTDKTRFIMDKFKNENRDFYSIQIFENPKQIQAAGWNVVIKNYTGDILVRIDSHAQITPEFSTHVVKSIESGESVVGGMRPGIMKSKTKWGNILLQVENSLFGSSINISRRGEKKAYVKTVFHAAYRREVFEKVGLFNELLLRTEDNEMHYRIRKAGYKIYFNPKIVSYQYIREDFRKMIKQKYANGYWIGFTLGVCPGCISFYHLIPFAFVAAIVLTSALACFGISKFAELMWGLYILFAAGNTLNAGIQDKFYLQSIFMPFMFLCLHLAYGWGTALGIFRVARLKLN